MNDVSDGASTIHCRDLSVVFRSGVRAVDQASFLVPKSEIFSLIGPSGCGKTTLLRAMAGLQPASTGQVELQPTAKSSDGEIAFVFQQPSLLPWRSAIENVMLPLELTGKSNKRNRRELAEQILETVHLSHALDRMPNQLSGGMKMRVSIARALVTAPKVLLLDEPFAALDDMLRNELGQLLLELWRGQQFTAVLVTHNIAESILLSHKIAVMKDGQIGDIIDNPLPRPRSDSLRRSPEFGEFYGLVSDALRAGEPTSTGS